MTAFVARSFLNTLTYAGAYAYYKTYFIVFVSVCPLGARVSCAPRINGLERAFGSRILMQPPPPSPNTHTHTHTLGVLCPAAPAVTDSVREDGRVHHVTRCSRGCMEDPRLVCVCVCVSVCRFGCGVGVCVRVYVKGVQLERAYKV